MSTKCLTGNSLTEISQFFITFHTQPTINIARTSIFKLRTHQICHCVNLSAPKLLVSKTMHESTRCQHLETRMLRSYPSGEIQLHAWDNSRKKCINTLLSCRCCYSCRKCLQLEYKIHTHRFAAISRSQPAMVFVALFRPDWSLDADVK